MHIFHKKSCSNIEISTFRFIYFFHSLLYTIITIFSIPYTNMLCPNNYLGLRVISIFDYCKSNNVNLLISYSNKGLVSVDRLHEIAQAYFKNVSLTKSKFSIV